MSLNASGTACGAGQNEYGELGDGTLVNQWTPVQVTNLAGSLSAIATGQYHTIAAKSDGTVWTWGYNGYGELGTGNTVDHPTPASISASSGLTGVVAVAAGQYHSLALTSTGFVYAWGYNGYGQIGDGTTTNRTAPVQVIQLTNVVAIAAGQDFSLATAILRTGRALCRLPVCPGSLRLPLVLTTAWPARAMAPCGRGVMARTENWATAGLHRRLMS